MSTAVGQEIVISPERSAALALVANHFISQFEGEQTGQCQSALALILEKNREQPSDLSLGLRGLIVQALQAAYLQGYAEHNQSSAGSFHLDVDVPLPTIAFAVRLNSALKFAIQTAYTLGRNHGKADGQFAIASGDTERHCDSFGQWLWARLIEKAYYLRLTKKGDSKTEESRLIALEHSIYSFDEALFIYCRHRFESESIEIAYKVGLLAEKIAENWKLGRPTPPEPSECDL